MSDDTEYNRKLESLQQYIPFLDNMIIQLKDPSKKNREQQLTKMQSLHAMITDKRKKLKLETLVKCEDVISKLYEKVHTKPITKKSTADTSSTPASPSPPREIIATQPLTIPTERVEESRIPKIDIYSSAGESLTRLRTQQNLSLPTKVPDMSKPPISLEDLKTLEDDVQEKINESSLNQASLYELNSLKEKLTEQIHIEEVLSSPEKNKKDELGCINTTVRNNLNLTKKVIQPPDKSKSKEICKNNTSKPPESSSVATSPKKEHKSPSVPPVNKPAKILKEPASIFGNILSHIDDQILVKKKKEERRNSLTGKDEKKYPEKKKDRRHSTSKDDNHDDKKDAKKKESRSHSVEDKGKAKDEKKGKEDKEIESNKKERHRSGDKSKSKDGTKETNIEESRKDDKSKHKSFSLSGKKSLETEEELLKKKLEPKETNTIKEKPVLASNQEKNKDSVGMISVKKDLIPPKTIIADTRQEESTKSTVFKKDLMPFKIHTADPRQAASTKPTGFKEDLISKTNTADTKQVESNKPTGFRRLADKYHPKPRKSSVETDVDKEVSDIIEQNMKCSPPKLPPINKIPEPIPPPASLLFCSQMEPEPEPAPPKLPPVLQNILAPGTTELINNVVSHLRQKNNEMENRKMPSLPAPADDNFVSEYAREEVTQDNFNADYNNFHSSQMRRERLNFEPPSHFGNNQYNQLSHQNRYMPNSLLGDGYNDNFPASRSFTPVPQGFSNAYNNFQPSQSIQNICDMQPLDYYPPNAPIPTNQYSCGPPLLSPEVPHYHAEQKPSNFGMMSNHDAFVHEDMRWRQDDSRFGWDRREDPRLNRDPRTYREYREMRESRDPRIANRDPRENPRDPRENPRDPRAIRDPRVNRDLRDPRENRDPRDRESRDTGDFRESRDLRDRDPRMNKERDFDRSRFRDSRPQTRDARPNRYESKFDRMYSRTNNDRSRSRSRMEANETFTSPLDSLYSGKEEHKTGKGYGVQNFRIPKVKKEDEEKEQSTKVSSTNEEADENVSSAIDESNESVSNEVTGNEVEPPPPQETKDTQQSDVKEDEKKTHEENNDKIVQETETDKNIEEPPKLQDETQDSKAVEPPKPTVEQEHEKPADQTILAQFFANLLGSKNKKDKKTALYSLISTFSDSFSEKELSKITKIIKADDEAESSEEEEEIKKPEEKAEVEAEIEAPKEPEKPEEPEVTEEPQPDDSPIKPTNRKAKRRIRRISSTASKEEKSVEESEVKTPEPPELGLEEESVVVSVGERIKSRKRGGLLTPPKPKKKFKKELDKLHEDIQDMFIRDGVLTASGKRMCRILKSDPNVLTNTEVTPTEPQKIRKKPGPKPKQRSNSTDMKTMKSIRILIPKIPDSSFEQKEESPKRNLRSATKLVYTESDDEDNSALPENDSVIEESSLMEEESDGESTDTEKDKTPQVTDNKSKVMKRKRGKGWASGNIPSNKKKRKKQVVVEEPEKTDVNESTTESSQDKSFVEPHKNYYIDFTNKAHSCKLCDYHGRFITTHYKTEHPESEVLTSRFSPAVAQEAIEDSKKNLGRYENLVRAKASARLQFTCRFCAFCTTVAPTVFYDHISTHTGEYRHICPTCGFSAANGKTLKSHMVNGTCSTDKKLTRKSYSQTIIFAYMCGDCNYVQLTQKHVEDHVNIFHLQKPTVYKVNMSTTLDPSVEKLAELDSKKNSTTPEINKETDTSPINEPTVEEIHQQELSVSEQAKMPPPQTKKRAKPGPKSMKNRKKAKKEAVEKDDTSDTNNVAEMSSISNKPEEIRVKPAPASKKKLIRELSTTSEEEVPVRSRRAAKDKAAEKLKSMVEYPENPTRKRSLSSTSDEEKSKKDSEQKEDTAVKADQKLATAVKADQKLATTVKADQKSATTVKADEKSETAANPDQKLATTVKPDQKLAPAEKPDQTLAAAAKEDPPKIKKEIEMNVFTCKTDILEENKKIEQERLQLMDELNKSVGSRTSLNFVDKLCDRLNQKGVVVKQELTDDFTESLFPPSNQTPLTMPVLEKNLPTQVESTAPKAITSTPPPKKPVLETVDVQVSNSSFDVTQKNDKIISDMILKLKGKLATTEDNPDPIPTEDVDDYDEGPPPLTHVNELPNVKPADGNSKILMIGGLVKLIKQANHIMFSCLVPPCVFSTEDKEIFRKHCSETHKDQGTSTLCEMCGMEITTSEQCTLLENIFKHAIQEHADFISNEPKGEEKPPTRVLRLRKLSGDALSIKKDWDEEISNTAIISIEKAGETSVHVVSSIPTVQVEEEPPVTMAELNMSDDNPFPFKIAGVMSLAEPIPPLAPIFKPAPQNQLVVKEAKLTQAELSKPRKTPKAMIKFISSVSDLYKCPHYYCLFSTNFKDFLERHLKAHKLEPGIMLSCLYCDMKTPWEHIPMHIDVRHAHCRFACSFCLYRAVAKEYVFLHQDQLHPESDYSVIALPQPKQSRKWAIADVKPDVKTLCRPYKCTTTCRKEFLFENEFKKHLIDLHNSPFLPCGFPKCMHRLQANKMPLHWSLNHGVSAYQCGYCKFNSNDMKQVYIHFAMVHPGLTPEILLRRDPHLQEGFLGYTQEAFNQLRKAITIPSNISGENKLDRPLVEPPAIPVVNPSTALKMVPPLSSTLTKGVIIPGSKSVVNRALTLVNTNSPASSAGNIFILPNVTSSGTLSHIVMSPQSNTQITSVAPAGKTVKVVPSIPTVITAMPENSLTSIENDKGDSTIEKDSEVDLNIEHITLSEDNNQNAEEGDTCEADPLSLEVESDLNDASKLAGDSSDDETDVNKADKSKDEPKIGLMGYQLYRCAFCDISFSNSSDFKRHATYSVNCRKDSQIAKPFICVHCEKQVKSAHILVEHIQCHGVMRFTCSLCENKYPTVAQTRSHIKNRHNITHTSVSPLNPARQNIEIDEFVVKPKLTLQMGAANESTPAEPSTSSSASVDVYTPETIDQIPMRHILSASAKCGLCSYTTKVRTNMVRHLQFHSEEKAVPDTAPVNPVPCLEKNEKMFDKMVNLASSSHTSSRMGGSKAEPKDKEVEKYPEFIPSHCRYVCCAHGCSYICPEEGNLRHHLIALHDSETSFTCVHCKADLTPTDADSLMKHFKLHGLQLYKCQYCAFIHNLKHKVEKHSSDCHLDVPVKVITVRFMESEPKDTTQEPSTSAAQSTPGPVPTKYYKPWRCCMCKYKCGSQESIQSHVLDKHEIESQFKCALCSYKTNDKETFPEHFKVSHDNQAIDVIYAYRKMEEEKEKERETFDTTPLWQRDRPRVRHIRGILFEESSPTPIKPVKKAKAAPTSSPGPSGSKTIVASTVSKFTPSSPGPSASHTRDPSPNRATPSPTPVTPSPGVSGIKANPTPSSSTLNNSMDVSIESVVNGTADILKETSSAITDDFIQTVNKLVKETNEMPKLKDSAVIVIDDEDEPKPPQKNKDNKNCPSAKNRKKKSPEESSTGDILNICDEIIDLESSGSDTEQDEFSEKSLKLRFGGCGAPQWKQFKCPRCVFKSKKISDFVFHMYKEMRIFRFKCNMCSDESITYRYMYKHIINNHTVENFRDHLVILPTDEGLLIWIQMVVREQSMIIMQNYPKSDSAARSSQGTVSCEFCTESFTSVHEKNEHSVSHWTRKPYQCSSCTFSSFIEKEVLKHFKSTHVVFKVKDPAMVVKCAPTVEQLILLIDDMHMNEVPKDQTPKVVAVEDSPAPGVAEPSDEQSKDSSVEPSIPEGGDAMLTESDLIIVTKTETNVPSECDVFCCEYCAYLANSEMQVLQHLSAEHGNLAAMFKKLNRVACEDPKEYVGCMLCDEVGSEVRIRQHHLEKHTTHGFAVYRYQCRLCPTPKRFLKLMGAKVHFNRVHPGLPMQYTFLQEKSNASNNDLKLYKCPLCSYARELKHTALNNIRAHLKLHFKAFSCGICKSVTYKTRADVLAHYGKEHPFVEDQTVLQDPEVIKNLSTTLAEIVSSATEVSTEKTPKNTARKSTSAPQELSGEQEYSFYGVPAEQVDMNKIMTSVDINGMNLNMSAEKLSNLFDLNVAVVLQDCNLGVNLSNVFDS